MKSLYDIFMKPLEKRGINNARKSLISKAYGNVLEIGAGTGANINYYNHDVIDELVLSDKKISKTLNKQKEHKILEVDVEKLPFEDDSFDCVVHTLVFCSIPNVSKGIEEITRVLKAGGSIIFIEHVLPHKRAWKRVFKIINPIWRRVASGCNVTREYEKSIQAFGYEINESNRFMKTVFVSGIASLKV